MFSKKKNCCMCLKYSRWESNPQYSGSKPDAYANFATQAHGCRDESRTRTTWVMSPVTYH